MEDFRGQTFEGMVDEGFVVIGSPDEVADKLKEIATSQNVGNLLLMTQFGNMRSDLARYNIEMIAKRVKPQIENIFANDWEHRWWPKPLEERAQPADVAR